MVWGDPKRPHFFKRDGAFLFSSSLGAWKEVRSYEVIELSRIQCEGKEVPIGVNGHGDNKN
jgi:hypothetical protein